MDKHTLTIKTPLYIEINVKRRFICKDFKKILKRVTSKKRKAFNRAHGGVISYPKFVLLAAKIGFTSSGTLQ